MLIVVCLLLLGTRISVILYPLLRVFLQAFSWSIWFRMLFVKMRIKRLAAKRSISVSVSWIGAVAIDPKNCAIWVKTDRDFGRDDLAQDASFRDGVYEALKRCRYPPEAIPYVDLAIQSQQTVDRTFKGNWSQAMH